MQEQYSVNSLLNVTFRDYTTKQPLAFFPELKSSNFTIDSTIVDATGGKGNHALLTFNDNFTASLRLQVGKLPFWVLGALTNGVMQQKNNVIQDMIRFSGKTGILPHTPIAGSMSVYLLDPSGMTNFGTKLGTNDYTMSGTTITIKSENEFSTNWYAVDYSFNAYSTNITVSAERPPQLYTVNANIELQSDGTKSITPLYLTIPKARISNVFQLLMANLDAGNQNHTLEVLAMKEKDNKGIAVLQLLS